MSSQVEAYLEPLRQMWAGAIETFGSSPAVTGPARLVPGFVWSLPLLGELGLQGLNAVAKGVHEAIYPGSTYIPPDIHFPGAVDSARALEPLVEQANEISGAQNPTTFGQHAARVTGSMLIPSPIKFPAGSAARLATEFVLPGSQIRSAPGVAAAVGIPAGLATALTPEPQQQQQQQQPLIQQLLQQQQQQNDLSLLQNLYNMPSLPDSVVQQNAPPDPESDWALPIAAGAAVLAGGTYAARRLLLNRRNRIPQGTDIGSRTKEADLTIGPGAVLTENVADRLAVVRSATKTAAKQRQATQGLSDVEAYNLVEDIDSIGRTAVTPSAISSRFRYIVDTGEFPGLLERSKPIGQLLDNYAQLPTRWVDFVDDYLQVRMFAKDYARRGQAARVAGHRTLREWINRHRQNETLLSQLQQNDPHMYAAVRTVIDDSTDFFHKARDYAYKSGAIDEKTYRAWKYINPNYVPMRANFMPPEGIWNTMKHKGREVFRAHTPETHTERRPSFLSRDEFFPSRLDPSESHRPVQTIPSYLMELVRFVEHNKARREYIDFLQHTPGNPFGIRKAKYGETANVVEVVRFGRQERVYIPDNHLAAAIRFRPGATFPFLNLARRTAQELITGRGAPLFAAASVAYETVGAVLTAKSGQLVGVGDELLARAGYTRGLTGTIGMDPTAFISPITGSGRMLFDKFMSYSARTLEDSLFRSKMTGQPTAIVSMLGPQRTQVLARVLADAYEKSATAAFYKYGAGHSTIFNAHDDVVGNIALNELAPKLQSRLLTGKLTAARATSLWRAYEALLESLHSGVRLQAAAANLAKAKRQTRDVGQRELAQAHADLAGYFAHMAPNTPHATVLKNPALETLHRRIQAAQEKVSGAQRRAKTRAVAEARTLAGDITQQGLGFSTRLFNSQALYSNAFIQVTAEHARALRRNPKLYLTRASMLAAIGTSALLMQLNGSEKAIEHYYKTWTPEDRAKGLPFYDDEGNLMFEYRIDHLLRPFWTMWVEALGSLLGFKGDLHNDADKLTVANLQGAAGRLMHSFDDDVLRKEYYLGARSAAFELIPDPFGPVAGGGLALGGVDPNKFAGHLVGRYGGSGLRKDEIMPGGETHRVRVMLNELFPTIAEQLFQSAILYDAYTGDFGKNLENGWMDALRTEKQALDIGFDDAQKSWLTRSVFGPSLWGEEPMPGYLRAENEMVFNKKKGMREAIDYFNRFVRAPGMRTLTHKGGELEEFNFDMMGNTALPAVAGPMLQLNNFMGRFYDPQFKMLQARKEQLRMGAFPGSRQVRLQEKAKIRMEELRLSRQLLQDMTATEVLITQVLGLEEPFRLEDFDPSAFESGPLSAGIRSSTPSR